jgi:hypothetical protein
MMNTGAKISRPARVAGFMVAVPVSALAVRLGNTILLPGQWPKVNHAEYELMKYNLYGDATYPMQPFSGLSSRKRP